MSVDIRVPVCKLGFTREQVEQLVAEDIGEFDRWIFGQTFAICEGPVWDFERQVPVPSCGVAHGTVYYSADVIRFLSRYTGPALATADDVLAGRARYADTAGGHADRKTLEGES